jgi:hypothetical protein
VKGFAAPRAAAAAFDFLKRIAVPVREGLEKRHRKGTGLRRDAEAAENHAG